MSSSRVWTLVDGVFQPGGMVPVTDRAFRYGMSIFETIAIRNGCFLLWHEHLQRLIWACAAAGFPAPTIRSLPENLPDGVLRIYVTAGDGPPMGAMAEGRVFAFFDEALFPAKAEVEKGIALSVSRVPFSPDLGGWKTGNYWSRVQAFAEAQRAGYDESLIFNVQGALIGAAMANVFLIFGERIVTPALSVGARNGAVRHWLVTRIPVEEAMLTMEDVEGAKECFLTNSRLGVMPAAHIESRRLPSRETGKALANLYCEEIL